MYNEATVCTCTAWVLHINQSSAILTCLTPIASEAVKTVTGVLQVPVDTGAVDTWATHTVVNTCAKKCRWHNYINTNFVPTAVEARLDN